jgi:hypothetical protein
MHKLFDYRQKKPSMDLSESQTPLNETDLKDQPSYEKNLIET